MEFLNTINASGLPPHTLELKKGQPIILLRNVCPAYGLCNGTRLICRNFYSRLIEAEIAVGPRAGQIVYIPRMPLIHSDTSLPFDFKRVQFPMSINKAQGQTLKFVGLWLEDPVFSHGQPYVGLSRVSRVNNVKFR
jgi:ATP-dependent DNA helicase PIF1